MLVLVDTQRTYDGDDFATVFATHQRAVYQLAFVLCGDASLAEDATAEAFAHVYRRWSHARPADPGAYLRRAVVNQVRGRFRRLRIERTNADRRSANLRSEAVQLELRKRRCDVVHVDYKVERALKSNEIMN